MMSPQSISGVEMTDTHRFEDGTALRIRGDNVLVREDPISEKTDSGMLYKPDGAVEHVVHTGTVCAFGDLNTESGPVSPPGLEVGMKCAYIRFLREQESNLQIRKRFGEEYYRVKTADILFVYPEDAAPRIG